MTIDLRKPSQDLIIKLSKKKPHLVIALENKTSIDRSALIDWFGTASKIKSDDEEFFLIASLRASLLNDLNQSLSPNQTSNESKEGGFSAKAKYLLLALAGTIYFGCEGFDGVTAIMGVFSSIPTIAIFAAGTLFSILSIIVFYSFDLVEISKNLGVKSSDAPKLIDVLLDEFTQIKAIRLKLSQQKKEKSKKELEDDLLLAQMLLQRHNDLQHDREQLKKALNNPYLRAGRMITAAIAGIIFFSGGFFAGQTVALAIASLFVASIAATAWPIIVASIAVGLAALSVYWFVERPGIENLISRWKGLDKDKIDQLCEDKYVDRETAKLENLIAGIQKNINLLDKEEEAQAQIESLKLENGYLLGQVKELVSTQEHSKELLADHEKDQGIISQLQEELSQAKSRIEILESEKVSDHLKLEHASRQISELSEEIETLQQVQESPKHKVVPIHFDDEPSQSAHVRNSMFHSLRRVKSTGNLLEAIQDKSASFSSFDH
ncbi:coiled-coil protein [Legionella wadsworthii]|uniref:Coiled-coil protein n=1 Tax=Legionella wadsworthii TaxID=28088 RepID=A0A378LUT9_9GAMM|nr:hypothetical protein [Legionella wadsworthii]STY31038.1 coiled-coil protein [Legionella wadsworthii]